MATDLKALVPYWGGDVTPLPCPFCKSLDLMIDPPRGWMEIEVSCASCGAAGPSSDIDDDVGAIILWNIAARAPHDEGSEAIKPSVKKGDIVGGSIDFLGPDKDSVSGICVAIVSDRMKIRYNHGTPDSWGEYWSYVPDETHDKSWKMTAPEGCKVVLERDRLFPDYQLTTA